MFFNVCVFVSFFITFCILSKNEELVKCAIDVRKIKLIKNLIKFCSKEKCFVINFALMLMCWENHSVKLRVFIANKKKLLSFLSIRKLSTFFILSAKKENLKLSFFIKIYDNLLKFLSGSFIKKFLSKLHTYTHTHTRGMMRKRMKEK